MGTGVVFPTQPTKKHRGCVGGFFGVVLVLGGVGGRVCTLGSPLGPKTVLTPVSG